ncbi:MAG: nucleoside 2-deoxyribosyltransferase [Proteobacteria bacterium]|nr:nucleoside 2-deoxyribosyltransferase [Pseudomonadota bacterium]
MPDAPPKRIYLAGPEVFLPDALAVGRAKAELCAAAGFEGCFPLDQSLPLDGLPLLEKARRISLANEALMRSCDLLIANLTPFRGVSMDSGTAFEVGFMRALGRPVLGYTNVPGDYRRRAEAFRARGIPEGDADAPGIEVEDFGMAENLMIAVAIIESGGSVVEGRAPQGCIMADLEAFKLSLDEARRLCNS